MPYEYEQDKERRGGVPARGLSDAKTAEERDSATGGRETTKIAESGKRGAPTQLPYLAELERSLGADLKGIRAYSGRSASEASERLDAQAYTHRGDVVLGQGADKRVVAEEAAHALQQTRLQGAQQSYGITAVESSAEVEARGAADATPVC